MSYGVLLVDDNAQIRLALRRLFEDAADFEVWGEAGNGRDAIGEATRLKPHLIILDFEMPVMNGLEAAPLLLRKLPTVVLILFTQYGGKVMEASARDAGIHAFVPKERAATHLIPTAQALLAKASNLSSNSASA
jgi:DNA-binding NarL/FixJ family response regulator